MEFNINKMVNKPATYVAGEVYLITKTKELLLGLEDGTAVNFSENGNYIIIETADKLAEIPEPKKCQIAIAQDTLQKYEYDGTEWKEKPIECFVKYYEDHPEMENDTEAELGTIGIIKKRDEFKKEFNYLIDARKYKMTMDDTAKTITFHADEGASITDLVLFHDGVWDVPNNPIVIDGDSGSIDGELPACMTYELANADLNITVDTDAKPFLDTDVYVLKESGWSPLDEPQKKMSVKNYYSHDEMEADTTVEDGMIGIVPTSAEYESEWKYEITDTNKCKVVADPYAGTVTFTTTIGTTVTDTVVYKDGKWCNEKDEISLGGTTGTESGKLPIGVTTKIADSKKWLVVDPKSDPFPDDTAYFRKDGKWKVIGKVQDVGTGVSLKMEFFLKIMIIDLGLKLLKLH